MKPITNILHWIQYFSIFLIWHLQENSDTQVPKTHYKAPSGAGGQAVGFFDLFIDAVLEVQDKNIVKYPSKCYVRQTNPQHM